MGTLQPHNQVLFLSVYCDAVFQFMLIAYLFSSKPVKPQLVTHGFYGNYCIRSFTSKDLSNHYCFVICHVSGKIFIISHACMVYVCSSLDDVVLL